MCYILDEVLSAIFCNKGGCAVAEKVLLESYKVMEVFILHVGSFIKALYQTQKGQIKALSICFCKVQYVELHYACKYDTYS